MKIPTVSDREFIRFCRRTLQTDRDVKEIILRLRAAGYINKGNRPSIVTLADAAKILLVILTNAAKILLVILTNTPLKDSARSLVWSSSLRVATTRSVTRDRETGEVIDNYGGDTCSDTPRMCLGPVFLDVLFAPFGEEPVLAHAANVSLGGGIGRREATLNWLEVADGAMIHRSAHFTLTGDVDDFGPDDVEDVAITTHLTLSDEAVYRVVALFVDHGKPVALSPLDQWLDLFQPDEPQLAARPEL